MVKEVEGTNLCQQCFQKRILKSILYSREANTEKMLGFVPDTNEDAFWTSCS